MESREHLEQAAAMWIARRDAGPWTAEDAAALHSWLAESAGHRVAYYRLDAAWHEAGRLKALKGSGASIGASQKRPTGVVEAPDSGHARSQPRVARGRQGIQHLSKSAVAIAATLLIHIGGAAILWLHGAHHANRYITAIGELQSIPMPDGSRVTLNTASSLRIDLKRGMRRIDLDHGEAFFEVAKDPTRPFVVAAGDRMIIAVGTQFAVRRENGDVRVIVSEGTVRMEPSRRESTQPRGTANALWSAGTVALVQGDSVLLQKEATAEIDESLSWRIGLLTFHDTPLASVVAEFNRYNARKVLIQDPGIAVIPISGVFRSTHLAPFIHVLEQRFAVQATVEDDRVLLSASDTGAFTHEEQALLDRGFHVVMEDGHYKTDHGEKIFCRKETEIGPRIPTNPICGTARQLMDISRQTQNALREGVAVAVPSSGNTPAARRSIKSGTDRILCSRGEPALAIESCSRIINDPGSPTDLRDTALRNRGWLLQSQGDFDRAIEDYSAVLQLSPAEHTLNAQTYVNRGLAFADKGDDKSALADYEQALTLDRTLSSAYLNRAAIYVRRGEEARALADLDEALRLDPKVGSAYVNRGTLYIHRGDAGRAIADFSTAIALNPKDAAAWRARGFAYRAQGDNAKAAADAEEAIRLDPDFAAAHEDLALIMQARGDTRSASTELDKAVALSPHDAKAMLIRGDGYLAAGDRDRAISDYSQAIALDPKLANAYINRGVAYMGKADWDRAIADFTAVMGVGTGDKLAAYIDRGQALESKGDRHAALADFDQALRLKPDATEALRHRGFLRQANGDYPGAAADYGQVIGLAPADGAARRGRGYAELSQRQYDAAIADLTEAIRLNPNDAAAYRYRSLAYAEKHDTQRATSDDQAALRIDPKRH